MRSDGERSSASRDWQQRSLRHVWHPCTQMRRATHVPPLPIACGDGPWLEDFEGRRYFDATSSWWVNLLGRSPYLASLDADRSLAGAEAALAASDGQIAADQVKLFLVLGGGWGPKANRPSPVSTP